MQEWVNEQRRLETNMNVQQVDLKLYVYALKSKNITYDT